ncbi:MAG: GlsB/YeaQ/YmgE family stress response membrane protein [Actinobacteria bacterium]|nr:MAG: GlsB/YeaQ/YmgE family stress response membrane protein [Actinomycetota bacterium]
MDIIAWLIVGLLAGAIARALVPGPDPMGLLGTMLLGLVGSVIGGLIGNLFVSGDQDLTPAGLIGSILGAVIALLVYRAATRRRTA